MSDTESTIVLQPVGDLVIVPLRGPIHHELLNELSAKVLDYLLNKGARGIILDMAGVEILDEQDFNDLRKVAQSALLMGAPVALAGIRPGVAVGLTMLGVEDDWIRATRTVELAMDGFSDD